MGRKLSLFEKELYQRTDEVLHYVWDPIGVAGIPQARDEYYAYIPEVFSMLLEQKTVKEISEYLSKVEGESMGGASGSEGAAQVAAMLIDWRESLREKYQT